MVTMISLTYNYTYSVSFICGFLGWGYYRKISMTLALIMGCYRLKCSSDWAGGGGVCLRTDSLNWCQPKSPSNQ